MGKTREVGVISAVAVVAKLPVENPRHPFSGPHEHSFLSSVSHSVADGMQGFRPSAVGRRQ